ncbi:hypothetical protein BJX66DRAFT_318950 [Aspergillus keveii]|uniref:Nephrocystin 3-like N-terminal domain-containing protein n=1 Tax=Aspergillus keveii TaxID=714993 RepID=A0ABR4FJ09_9EURO
MAKNHHDLRTALYESSEYLADVLTQTSFIEENIYRGGDPTMRDTVGDSIIGLYKATLCYTAQIQSAPNASIGKKILDLFKIITDHPLTELQGVVEAERNKLRQWIDLHGHLQRGKEAEAILSRIDELVEDMKRLNEHFNLINLPNAEGALYDSYVNEHEDFCLADTRTKLVSQVCNWAESSDGKCIVWLNGMARTGKSTLARTVAKLFDEKGVLGALFFFKRGETDRGSAKYLVPTITRQLVNKHRQLQVNIRI